MNTTRRIFSKWFAAAPAIGFATLKVGDGPTRAIHPIPARSYEPTDAAILRIPDPPGVAQYWNARAEYNKTKEYWNLLSTIRQDVHRVGMPPNIAALKSISNTYRYHMIAAHRLQVMEQERTFSQRLMDTFGVREWFEKQYRDNGGPAEVQSGSIGF